MQLARYSLNGMLWPMKLKFTKMQGLGNDFVVLDAINQSFNLTLEQSQWIADRHFGIGCDQILVVESAIQSGVDFKYRIFNADGSEVSQCGNGARCFARFVKEKGLTDKNEIIVETNAGIMVLTISDSNLVTVNMGVPKFEPQDIPLNMDKPGNTYHADVNGQDVAFGAVSMGNPHAVLLVDDISTAPLDSLGKSLESHAVFPERANIGFLQVVDSTHAKLRVYERGAAETLACGSGACGAAVIGQTWGLLESDVVISLPGGDLRIQWQGAGEPVMMTGPAEFVFEGEVVLPQL